MKRIDTFYPVKADSIGIIMNYRCTNHCAHCLYACHPGVKDHMTEKWIEDILQSISDACPLAALHIGGGEPFLYPDFLRRLVKGVVQKGLYLEYVETNGFWIRKSEPGKLLESIKNAGCNRLLLSISPFHNAFLSMEDNLSAKRLITEVFGEDGIFAWHPAYYSFLQYHLTDKPVSFRSYIKKFSKEELLYQLTGIIYLHPAGRAALNFKEILPLKPAARYFQKNCHSELASPVHAHVDLYGNYLTGFCAGLTIGVNSAFRLRRLFEEGLSLNKYPILSILINESLDSLYAFASKKGFISDPKGYISPCHLCAHLRTYLFFSDERYAELKPDFFYHEMRKGFVD